MRHRKTMPKLSRSRAQRKALKNSLVRSLLLYERITTTESKAKAIRPSVAKLITWAKTDTLHNRRLSYNVLQDHKLVKRLFERIGPRYTDVQGGYVRIVACGYRKGDGAKFSLLELTKREVKDTKSKKGQKGTATEADAAHAQEGKKEKSKGFASGVKKIFKKER